MKTAVVILNWNGRSLLEQFLPKVLEHSLGFAEVFVADNASTDDSIAFVTKQFPQVKIIQNEKNLGYAGGYNEALKKVDADIFVLLNSDVEVTKGWLNAPLAIFTENTKVAAIQPKILDFKNPEYFEYAGAAGGFIDKYGFPYCRGRVFNTVEKDRGQYDDTIPIFWASGACFFIRAVDFWDAGGFDSDYFAHQEEIDLCWRLQNNGKIIFYCGCSVVYHVGGATLENSNPKKTYLNFRNSLFTLLKNLPKSKLFPIIFIRMIFDGIAGLHFLISGKFSHLWSVLLSHFSFYRHIFKYYNKRVINSDINYYQVKSIVFLYFIKQLKYFYELKKN